MYDVIVPFLVGVLGVNLWMLDIGLDGRTVTYTLYYYRHGSTLRIIAFSCLCGMFSVVLWHGVDDVLATIVTMIA